MNQDIVFFHPKGEAVFLSPKDPLDQMPSTFFSYDLAHHAAKEGQQRAKLDPRIRKAELQSDYNNELEVKAKVWAGRELRAVSSAADLAKHQHGKYLVAEKEWRIRSRIAVQRKKKYEVTTIS